MDNSTKSYLAELLGTFTLVFIGGLSVVAVTLAPFNAGGNVVIPALARQCGDSGSGSRLGVVSNRLCLWRYQWGACEPGHYHQLAPRWQDRCRQGWNLHCYAGHRGADCSVCH